MRSIRNIVIPFAVGTLLINSLVVALLGLWIRESRIHHKEQAAISSRNLAQVLDENIKGIIDRVDMTLLSVADEAEKQIKGGGIQKPVINAYIVRQLERVPELDSLRMTNANGDILYGPGVVPGINIADRDYFYKLRDDSKTGVVISKPYVSRTTGKWQISISRRILRPDGSFSGIAYGNFTLDYFTRMFSGIDVGMHGAIAMWNMDFELIARYPEPKRAGSEAGLKLHSAAFNESLQISKEKGTYTTQSNVDKVERTFSYRKISKYPIYILVGMATQDYLAEWRKEALKKSAFGVFFFLISLFFSFLFYKYLTGSRRAEQALEQANNEWSTAMDASDDIIYLLDTERHLIRANKAFYTNIDTTPERAVGSHIAELIHIDKSQALCPVCKAQNEQLDTIVIMEKDHICNIFGRPIESTVRIIRNKQGQPISILTMIHDLSRDRKIQEDKTRLEMQLSQSQKMEAVGQLAGGIAHDFNNLLQSIFGYISMAKLHISNPRESLSVLSQAEKALDMAVNLTKQLLTFSKGGKPATKPISLMPIIENAAKFALSGSRASCQFDIEPGLWQVDADEGQLGQVIQNIVLNADQAMSEGGNIVITAKNLPEMDKEHPQLPKSKYVEISVKDSGIGIPEKYLQKIFNPYFTTKEKGSGLGLATSYSIIRNHGGLINVTSEPGRGTTFFIYLPATEEGQEIKETPTASAVVRQGKILVMDDEEMILNVAELQLKTLGFEVDLAKHGKAVIEKYQAAMDSGKPFDIVILDLTIRGGMGGKETLEQLRIIHPGVKAIVSSGYSSDNIVAEYEKYGFKARLNKPYKLEILRETLNALLDE